MAFTLSITFLGLQGAWADTVIKTIHVGSDPFGIAYNSINKNVYVANYGDDTVSVINGSTNEVVKNITVGEKPIQIAFNPSNNNMYVTNYNSGTVSVITVSSAPIQPTKPQQ